GRRAGPRAALILAAASPLVDYAIGIWPHAISLALVTGAAWALAVSVRDDRPLLALLAGALLGAAINARVDALFAWPALVLWTLAMARRVPVTLLALAAGAVPFLLLASWANLAKWGDFSPISYGPATAHHASSFLQPLYIAGAAVAVALALAVRSPALGAFAAARPRAVLAAGVGLVAAAILLLPPLRTLAGELLWGAWVLGVNFQAYTRADASPGILADANGLLVFWGIHKKALTQSLPWIGLAIAALPLLARREGARGAAFCLLPIGLWLFPFARTEWHGGLSASMRYLLPVVPYLAILAALGWARLARDAGEIRLPRVLILALAAVLAVGVAPGLALGREAWSAIVQAYGTLALAAVVAALTLAALVQARFARAACHAALVAYTAAGVIAYGYDLGVNQERRNFAERVAAGSRGLPPEALVVAHDPAHHLEKMVEDRGAVATLAPAQELVAAVDRALAEGRPVYVQEFGLRDAILAARPGLAAVPAEGRDTSTELFRIEVRE
ncbi:MAG: hypothetical protein AAFW69_09945, partial [Pseudomonadota bacterium]